MSTRSVRHTPGRRLVTAAAGVLALAGAGLLATAFAEQSGPAPQPSAAAGAVQPVRTSPARQAGTLTMPVSKPVSLTIPAIGLSAQLTELGKNPDGTVQVPDQPDQAGWYKYSSVPGQLGPAVILGHVDFASTGPAVFFNLGDLRPGELVQIHRADGSTAQFTVDAVREYPKDAFPTALVYGSTSDAALRLITCGAWDPEKHAYTGNTVVTGHLSARYAAKTPHAR